MRPRGKAAWALSHFGGAWGDNVPPQKKLFAFRDGAGGTVVDACEAFDAGVGIDHGHAVIADFDGFGGTSRFTRTTSHTNACIYYGFCHFASPTNSLEFKKTPDNGRFLLPPLPRSDKKIAWRGLISRTSVEGHDTSHFRRGCEFFE